ncbi:hypothetical protein AAVH_23978 [Aphelenchoides avenae]|nr:hypothetical protein AAVH_23978 [Aphelenchus avenae]
MQNLGNAVNNVQIALEKERERAKKHYDERNKVNAWKYKPGQRVMVLDPEIDDALDLSLQTVEITDRIVLREAKPGREASIYESDEKKVVLVALLDDSGLGPYSVCSGNCTSRCKVLHVSDVLPSYSGPEAKQAVPMLAHQVFLVELGKYLDEAELPAKITLLLSKSADLLNREFADLVGGRSVTAPSKELIQAQAYLRKACCHRVQVSLAHNVSVPIRVFGDNHDDHRYFTSSVYSSGTVSHPHIGADVLGPIWERVRNGTGRNMVSGPFLVLCPPGDEQMFRSDIVRIRTVSDLREAIHFLRTNIIDGSVQAVAISLPPPSKECPRRLDEMLNLLDEAAYKHIEFSIIPPPASVYSSYKDIVDRLLEEPRPQIVHGAAYAHRP